MKRELERMEAKVQELAARKGTIVAKAEHAKQSGAAGGAGVGGGAFAEFKRMEDQIEGVEAAVQAQSELDDLLGDKGPTGMSRAEVEAKFRQLEGAGYSADSEKTSEVDDELQALKKKIRIDT